MSLTTMRPMRALAIGAFLSVGTLPARIDGVPGGPPGVMVIDMHTHVFNARDLPLRGILENWGVPRLIAKILAAIIVGSTHPDNGAELQSADTIAANANTPRVTPLRPDERAALEGFVGASAESLLSEFKAMTPGPRSRWPDPNALTADTVLTARALQFANFPPADGPRASGPSTRDLKDLPGYIRFLGLMLQNHRNIAQYLKVEAYPQVDLFIHHMMDMEKPYHDAPANPFGDQVDQVQAVDLEMRSFAHFVAYDPFRRDEALAMAKAGVAAGAIGIKFYPPSGYRPTQNFFPEKPGIFSPHRKRWKAKYAGWQPADLDQNILAMFTWANQERLPVFLHCTPQGFEAGKHYGRRSDPYYWNPILANRDLSDLRVCFGHAGGEAYWISDPKDDDEHNKTLPPFEVPHPAPDAPEGDPWLFGQQIVEMCRQYPNVYCEVGYLDIALDGEGRTALSRRLAAIKDLPTSDGRRFADKIMYGTDWHMIHKEPDFEKYLAAWNEILRSLNDEPFRKAFFAGNAVKFLELERLAQDPRYAEHQKLWQELVRSTRKP